MFHILYLLWVRSLAMARGVRFSERVVQFYSGQLVLALEYLHHVGLLYRDLRPDTVLVDTRGYIRLRSTVIDVTSRAVWLIGDHWYLCRSLQNSCKLEPEERTFTMCGDPDYRAPEILLEQGYSFPVDWWHLVISFIRCSSNNCSYFMLLLVCPAVV